MPQLRHDRQLCGAAALAGVHQPEARLLSEPRVQGVVRAGQRPVPQCRLHADADGEFGGGVSSTGRRPQLTGMCGSLLRAGAPSEADGHRADAAGGGLVVGGGRQHARRTCADAAAAAAR